METETNPVVKKKRRTTAVSRTMQLLRRDGNICAVVEHFNPHVGEHGIRQDLFNIVDVLVLSPVHGFVRIQVCTGSSAAHFRKMTIEHAEECENWLKTPGGYLELWFWRQILRKKGGVAKKWVPRIIPITLKDLGE